MGTASIAHAAAVTDHPGRQAMWGVFSVIIDTMVFVIDYQQFEIALDVALCAVALALSECPAAGLPVVVPTLGRLVHAVDEVRHRVLPGTPHGEQDQELSRSPSSPKQGACPSW